MLRITVPASELWDPATETFVNTKSCTLTLEHSLLSISKWESKWHKPFMSKANKTAEETLDYVKCMTITQNVDPNVYLALTSESINTIKAYLEDSMTATTFKNAKSGTPSSEVLTSELIYYYMVAFNIPFECQKWPINRLFTLIKICDIKNRPSKKMSKRDIINQNAALNAARRAKSK